MGGEGSDRRWRDVFGGLKTKAAGLDPGYLRHGADALGASDPLERALAPAAL